MRVLVTHVPAGSGHRRAAEAIAGAIQSQPHPPSETLLLDALDKTSAFYRWIFTHGYFSLIHRAPLVWGLLYRGTDVKPLSGAVQALHRFSNALHGKALEDYLVNLKPDWIIGTHFFPMEVAAGLKERGLLKARLIMVITDYLPHVLWLAPGIDTYVVGSEEAREELIRRGIKGSSIRLLGIPVHPKFRRSGNREALSQRLGIRPDTFTVLIASGGSGTGPIALLVRALRQIRSPIQLLVVAGTNDGLFQSLESLRSRMPHPMKVYGFIHNMDELMEVSDLMISKPGGLTTAEATTKGLPLILVAPIPGQESRNAIVLKKSGVAIAARATQVPLLVERLFQDRQALQRMRAAALGCGFPDAALKIAHLVTAG